MTLEIEKAAPGQKTANDENKNNFTSQSQFPEEASHGKSEQQIESEILDHMRSNGIDFDGPIEFDQGIQRFSCDSKRNKKDEWYVAFCWDFNGRPYALCKYGSWSRQDEGTFVFESWDSDREKFTPEEKTEFKRRRQELDRLHKEEIEQRRKQAAAEARKLWDSASKKPTSPGHEVYLKKKGIKAPSQVRFGKHPSTGKDALIIPVWNTKKKANLSAIHL